jgi:hypothetical protein
VSDRVKFGYVVCYRHDPRYPGLDRFLLVDGAASAKTNCFSLQTATIFYVESEAAKWLARFPTVGDPHMPDELRKAADAGHTPGVVREVWRETRLVLGGESTEDLNTLLRAIRDSNDADRRRVADARGVAVADGDVRGFVETLPVSG